jgi:hypothetical protein
MTHLTQNNPSSETLKIDDWFLANRRTKLHLLLLVVGDTLWTRDFTTHHGFIIVSAKPQESGRFV